MKPRDPSVPESPARDYRSTLAPQAFYPGARDLNSDLYTRSASTAPTKPPPQPPNRVLSSDLPDFFVFEKGQIRTVKAGYRPPQKPANQLEKQVLTPKFPDKSGKSLQL